MEAEGLLAAVRPRWIVRTAEDGAPLVEERPAARRELHDDVAYLVPTSGSTGAPRIVMGSREGLGRFVDAELDLVGRRPWRVSRLTPPTFDVMLRDVFVPLAAGGTLCLLPSFEDRLDAASLQAWLDDAQVELVHCVPTILRALGRRLGAWRPATLRWLLVAGEPLFAADVRPWIERSDARVVNVYGTSETTLAKCFHVVHGGDLAGDRLPVGTCIPGAAAIVLDDGLRPCPPSVRGEIHLRTHHPVHGYLDRPDLTERRLVPNPVGRSAEDLVDRTGDLGLVRPDGLLEVVGRVDGTLKVRGMRVDVGEIEGRLRAHPAVRDCTVQVARNRENDAYLCAYVATEPGVGADDVRVWLAAALPAAAVPGVLLLLAAIPRNRRGKVDRTRLPEPDAGAAGSRPAETETERRVARVWATVLPASFGAEDDFGALGGQSIHAAQVTAELRSALGVELTLRDFYRLGTVAALARWIDERPRTGAATAVARPRLARASGDGPVSYAQRRFWRMLAQRGADPSFHYLWLAEVTGELDEQRLAGAVATVTARHPATRTVFVGGDDPVQRALPEDAVALEPAGETVSAHAALEWARRPFDLSREPPFRARLIAAGPGTRLLAIAGHVIVSDGRSKDILLTELGAAYRGGDPGPPPAAFADYARWERGAAAERIFAARLEHWRAALPGGLDEPPLPFSDVADGPARGAAVRGALGADARRALRAAARACGGRRRSRCCSRRSAGRWRSGRARRRCRSSSRTPIAWARRTGSPGASPRRRRSSPRARADGPTGSRTHRSSSSARSITPCRSTGCSSSSIRGATPTGRTSSR